MARRGNAINFVQLIARKRDRLELTESEIQNLIEGYTSGNIPDYQMSAFAMAVLLNGMSLDETVALTKAMLDSGRKLTWPKDRPTVDKHSTGGIGDKVSIPLAPMLACCGVRVPMISGRGLGPTGGTLDKLESIDGFRTDLSVDEIEAVTNKTGCVITGASPEIAPADRKLYALRDVTGTVESIPLITASILSKKIAAGLDALILDVKFGSGAFMKTEQQATELARSLVSVGGELGVPTTALLTNMNQVLGHYAGNAVEIQESIEFLNGDGPDDLKELTLSLGAHLLASVNGEDVERNRTHLQNTIDDGSASKKFQDMVNAQGGKNFEYHENNGFDILALSDGFLGEIDARQIGYAIIELGGGRKTKTDKLDLQVGIRQMARIGDQVTKGMPIFRIVSQDPTDQNRLETTTKILQQSFQIHSQCPDVSPLITKTIGPEDRD